MIFSDLYKSPRSPFSKLRNSLPHAVPPPPSDIDADLLSKDKAKAKEAVKRYLAERVRNDWEFNWPDVTVSPVTSPLPAPTEETSELNGNDAPLSARPVPDGVEAVTVPVTEDDDDVPRDPGEEADSESDAESVYSTISEDQAHFQARSEWTSDLSDDDGPPQPAASPFRFDSPDDVGTAVRTSIETKRTKRRRAVREEATWNPGLACFEARRNAWTGAKTVRVKPKPVCPVSPSSGRRLSFWRHGRTDSSASTPGGVLTPGSPPATSPLHPVPTRTSQQTDISAITPPMSESDSAKSGVQRTSSNESTTPHVLYPVETVVPIPPPFLPPQNAMRASITPSMYTSIYDKLVVQGLQPACPVNLSDMIRACVVGWKRDGEWPPRSIYPQPAPTPTAAELVAMRQRKAQQQQKINAARKAVAAANAANAAAAAAANSTSPPMSTVRRLSFGFLGGNSKGIERNSHSHSDEAGSGKALFRRSLQKVLSLGQHGHNHGSLATSPPAASPASKEATVAAMSAAL
ncbi:hypothetical protein QBC35DRAFT_390788 [Podospora australis]|uniref:Gag1-like clamp domain-containing protein n=1 Tax=Podospora australis TaxID=1536484 RepID=A0AAN6WMX3_9PEZI|nr:hypothetical protein QBC35DRAFT_390788 [Podospora australis]